jgi:3-oxoacyl-[acyl-carrier-protein] synthase-1
LRIIASGICCAVGYNAEAASCALRIGMDNFMESFFVANDGSPVRVAQLLNEDCWGPQRLALWARYAIGECLEQISSEEHVHMPVLFVMAALDRPMSNRQKHLEAARGLARELEITLPERSQVFSSGRAGLGDALLQAQHLLTTKAAQKVIVAGVDSYLDAQTISHFLKEERLLVPGNSNGFIPGEAAAAIVVELASNQSRQNCQNPHTQITGVGLAQEPGRPDGSVPSRAQGLTQAIRAAMQQADINGNAMEFRVSDQNGESFFAREAANALTRIGEPGGTIPGVLTTADCTGEIGAATGPLMLAWLHRWLPHADAPGACGLLHLANDDGARTAIVVQHRDGKNQEKGT